jgi:LAO/AO transport system kinase
MAAGRHLGGLAWRTRHCLTVFEAVYDKVIIETVGVGQSETEIGQVVDTVVFVIQPGSGDSLQFMKAGIMEIPHILVVNKADQQTLAMKAVNDLKAVASFFRSDHEGWENELVLTSASEGWGQEGLVSALEKHREFLEADRLIDLRRGNRIQWIYMLFRERFGTFGVETLGGESAAMERIEKTDIADPFEGLRCLTEEMWRMAGEKQ